MRKGIFPYECRDIDLTVVLLAATEFCRLVDIEPKRFEQRRLRERAVTDLRQVIVDGDDFAMPIAPTEAGKHARYDALDAIRMRCVIMLEQMGMGFGPACNFIRASGITAFLSHVDDDDFLAARWLEPGGKVRHVAGTQRDLAMAMPAKPLAAVTINVSHVAAEIARRGQLQLGLIVRHGQFYQEASK